MNASLTYHNGVSTLLRALPIVLLFFLPAKAIASEWVVEAEQDGKVTWKGDTLADIHAPGGLTLWNKRLMRGDVTIEYEARIVGDGRVSDLNCFWMASDPQAKDVFVRLKERGGKFVNTYNLRLYYVGYGGNYNSTTRFRRYNGDARGVEQQAYRPPILREFTDKSHLITADHWYKIRLEAKAGRVRYFVDGECLVDYADPKPLTEGYFGFRTTLAHAQLRNFKAVCEDRSNEPIVLHDVKFPSVYAVPQPMTFGVPFSQGELKNNALLAVKTGKGEELEADQWTLATWPDGSVKWKAVATVVPEAAKEIKISKDGIAGKVKKPATGKGQKTSHSQTTTKGIKLWKSEQSDNVLDSITLDGKKVCGSLWLEQNEEKQPAVSFVQEQSGKLRNCWRIDGQNYRVRLYTYKGSNEIKVVHTAFIDSLTNIEGLKSLVLKAEVPMTDALHHRKVVFLTDSSEVQRMDVKPLIARRPISIDKEGQPADTLSALILKKIAAWDGFRLSQLSPNAFSIRKRATSNSPWIGTIEGRRAPGVVAIGDRQNAVTFEMSDFWQSYPSTLQVDKATTGEAVLGMYLWSSEAEVMNFCHYDTIPHGLDAAYEDIQPGMSTANGIARTTTFYISPSLASIDSISKVLPLLARHSQFVPTPEYLHSKRAFGFWSLDRGTHMDSILLDIKQFYAHQQEKHGWYGYFNYGDFMHSYDGSRGEWRYDVGGYAWDNTELATPAMLWYEFLRTGDAETYRLAEAMTRHCSEVDCYHRGPHAGLGTRHNVLHWGCGAKEARISQAFWNRFLYYLTADERCGDLMSEVKDADLLLYSLDPMRLAQPRSPRYPCSAPARLRVGPDWMAYAANWFTEWERTGNEHYRDKILAGMNSIAALPHGLFSGPKALGYDPATGIVSWEGDTAMQNTNHLLTIMGGFEAMNEIMLSLSTPQWAEAWLNHATNYQDAALRISRNKFRVPRLLAYSYWLTGREKTARRAVESLMKGNPMRNKDHYFFTNDAATFTLDAIFMQEVIPQAFY